METKTLEIVTLLKGVLEGEIVLPDFQRSFIWEADDVKELIVSILGDYFIGTMLILDDISKESIFALRLIEGVEKVKPSTKIQSQVKILLDGQQRATALFYALEEPDIPLKNRKNPYKFYLDLDKALTGKYEESVIAISIADKKRLNEIKSSPNVVRLKVFKDIKQLIDIFKDHPRLPDILVLSTDFMKRDVYLVELSKDVGLEKIVETFERINRFGERLSTFELLTARLYKGKVKLVELWKDVKEKHDFIKSLEPEYVLRIIALIRGKDTSRKDLLELSATNFNTDWAHSIKALVNAHNRLVDLKNGYGILNFNKWFPYTPMVVPLAALLSHIKLNKKETKSVYDKIDCWYWVSVFSGRYDEGAVSKQSSDYKDVKAWIDKNELPDFIKEFNPKNVDFSVDKQNSAIYKGIMNLIVRKGALDFKTGQPPQFNVEKIEDDHIFPESIYHENGIRNRTLISTNSEKGNIKPSVFFKSMMDIHGKATLEKILATHFISPEALEFLLKDNLGSFMNKREQTIIKYLQELKKMQ